MRPCNQDGCPNLTESRYCPAHAKAKDQQRGKTAERGYGGHWQRFRIFFVGLLIAAGIAPVCGASLPTGPQTTDSQCKASGFLNSDDLHVDHEPPLEDWERRDVTRVCDPNRVQLLCRHCHNAKTKRQNG